MASSIMFHSFLRDTVADQDGSLLHYEQARWPEHKAQPFVGNIDILQDLDEFIASAEEGSVKELDVEHGAFIILKSKLRQLGLSYMYHAQNKKLIVMPPPSYIHDAVAVVVREAFDTAKSEQLKLNPELEDCLQTHQSLGFFYHDGIQNETYQPDMCVTHNNNPKFVLESGLSQSLSAMYRKVERILKDPKCWGALVVKVEERKRSEPEGQATDNDFLSTEQWCEEAANLQVDSAFGALSIRGGDWMGPVVVDLYFCPRAWCANDGLPSKNNLPPSGSIDLSFIDVQLTEVWSRIVRHAGKVQNVTIEPVPFCINWYKVRRRILQGLTFTGHHRYVRWYGVTEYNARCDGVELNED